MNQEYTEDKVVKLKKLAGRQRLFETFWLLVALFAVYLLAALLSFDPADPGWSQTAWHEPIRNKAGSFGAWVADILFFIFGAIAYALPVSILILCWKAFKQHYDEQHADYLMLSLRVIGLLALLLSSCALAAMNFDDLYRFSSGGLVGGLLSSVVVAYFNHVGTTLILLCIWIASFTLLTGWSWLTICEKVGWGVMNGLTLITNRVRLDETTRQPNNSYYQSMTRDNAKKGTTEQLINELIPHYDKDQLALDLEIISSSPESRVLSTDNYKTSSEVGHGQRLEPVLFTKSTANVVIRQPTKCKLIKRVPIKSNDPAEFLTSDSNDKKIYYTKTNHIMQEEPLYSPFEPPSKNNYSEYVADNTTYSPIDDMDSLIHPFLMRHERPLEKPTTPLPTLDLLTSPPLTAAPVDIELLENTARLVEDRLADYRVKADVVAILPGPVITLYELNLAPGVKAARISNLSRDLARSLSTVAVRVVEVIPGRPYVGLELPNKYRQTVYLREVLDCERFRSTFSPLAMVLGKDISGEPVVADLANMPHVLVAGTTGSGKSVGVNAMIISMLYKATPEEVRFIMIDPKMLELSVYEGIPHLLTEVVTDMKDASNALRWCVNEMEKRYKLMSALGVRNLAGYNEKIKLAVDMGRPIPDPFWKSTESMLFSPPVLEKFPYIVVIVDEFADLMMAVGKKVEGLIARLAQKARAAGIHLILATQRPSVDVITGLIKANIPTRIAFTVSSKIDSRTILDQAGAESLLGMGDMLYLPPNSSEPIRVHGAFVRDEEVHKVVQDWKARGKPHYVDEVLAVAEENDNGSSMNTDEELDPLFDKAVAFVIEKRKPSISGVQRQFRIGYNRAARIIEQMEVRGIVSSPANNGNREVLALPEHGL